jgi:RND family efflux transporter MFP subunit
MRRRRFTQLIAWILIGGGAASCGNGQPAAAPPSMPPTPVELATARPTDIEDATEYVGTLRSLRSTAIQPQVEGQITKVYVTSGERVAEGAPLVQIDPRRQEATVRSQEAERAAREAAVTYARQQADRQRELLAAGAISRQEAEQAETALRTAEANLASLQAQVREQEVQLHYYTATAPMAGIVGDVPVRVGNRVTTQTQLTTIDQNDTLEVNLSVPVERARALRIGLPLQVRSSDGADELSRTTVSFVAPRVDDQTQSVLVKGILANPERRMRPAQYVRARIVWATKPAIVVPVTAVLRVSGQVFAFVAEDAGGKLVARQRPITVGPITGDSYPIVAGVKPGDRIVVSGVQKLADGAPIQPASATP